MTIGVIDEVRKLGIGSKLLACIIDLMELQYKQTLVVYLHVVDYNLSALRFYEKNQFIVAGTESDHYEIHGKSYDAVTLYRFINQTGAKPALIETPYENSPVRGFDNNV
jgi:ribosomal protein S18 acetylase RimI-like enzyme